MSLANYVFVEKTSPTGDIVAAIKITDGEFADTVFNFEQIKFADAPDEDGMYKVSFSYTMHHCPIEKEKANIILLENILGSILEEVIEQATTTHPQDDGEEDAGEGNSIPDNI
jgi:hypothetical protein